MFFIAFLVVQEKLRECIKIFLYYLFDGSGETDKI